MSNTPRNLTRDQLAKFLPNARAIRAFEQVLKQAGQLLPDDIITLNRLIEETFIEAVSGTSKAQQALDALERIANALEYLAQAPAVDPAPGVADDLTIPAVAQLAEDNLTPPVPLGTLGMQQAEDVNITGGSITANLSNNQTTLLRSSVALANGAGAATGTLTNAPAAGNPTKWISIDDNGTTRRIPAW